MEIWAHRGCSVKYPENTIKAFEAAMNLKGLTGIELDVQLSKDDIPVVIHDETLERTTSRFGNVKDYTFTELKNIGDVPTLEEVLTLVKPKISEGLLLNIELKTSVYEYKGIEEKVLALVKQFGILDNVIFSSFNSNTTKRILELCPSAKAAALGKSGLECLNDANFNIHCNAIHPYIKNMDVVKFALDALEMDVRVWTKDKFYPHDYSGNKYDLKKLERKGITGIFLNDPERYLEGNYGIL